ncbi:MAG: hypothetical protein ACYC3G_03090, partial [Minisyncoccota bacterium]
MRCLIANYRFNKFLNKYKQNIPAKTVLILGHSNWRDVEFWTKVNFTIGELKPIIKFLELKTPDFSFYPNATFEDVEKIMANKNVREVYFLGHGDCHVFKLSPNQPLYYCDFNNEKYKKDYIHQVHCGDKYGKRLIDYVVPEENRNKCFSFKRVITSFRIRREFKNRIKALSNQCISPNNYYSIMDEFLKKYVLGWIKGDLEKMIGKSLNFPLVLCTLSYMEYLGSFLTGNDFNIEGNIKEYTKQCFSNPDEYPSEILTDIFR